MKVPPAIVEETDETAVPLAIEPVDEPNYIAAALSETELADIRETARKEILAEQHKELFAAELEKAKREARIKAGLADLNSRDGKYVGPRVTVRVSLPEGVTPIAAIIIDNRCFYDGATYANLPLPIAQQLNSMQWEAWKNQGRQDGHWTDMKRRNPIAINGNSGSMRGLMPIAIGSEEEAA